MLTALERCDYILHGGDINKPEIIEDLEQIAPDIVLSPFGEDGSVDYTEMYDFEKINGFNKQLE